MDYEQIHQLALARMERHQKLNLEADFDNLAVPRSSELVCHHSGLPDWWHANGNVMLAPAHIALPRVSVHAGLPAPEKCTVILGGSTGLDQLLFWGFGPLVIIGKNVSMPHGGLYCGGESTIIIGDGTACTYRPQLNARNGGLIYAGPDGLWAGGVEMITDDMHALRDLASGRRLNVFGGTVIVESHVWLATDVLLLPGAHVGPGSVIGARSVVTGSLPPNSVCVGAPARVVRQNIVWTHEDLP